VVGTVGLIEGVTGGAVAAILIKRTPLQAPDLLVTAALILTIIFALTWPMGRVGLYCEVDNSFNPSDAGGGWRSLIHSRDLLLIAALLLLAQLASPLNPIS
jgi:AAA family ATP:ADP antiporter